MTVYRTPVLENFVWQPSVITKTNVAPGSPVKGQRYLVYGTVAGGDPWLGKENNIAYCDTSGTPGHWTFNAPLEGMIVWIDNENKYYKFDGSTWTEYLGQQGIQGTKGDRGTHGTHGTKGSKGSKGSRGTHGTHGTHGTKGSKGSKGSRGSQGTKGPGATYSASYGCLIILTS